MEVENSYLARETETGGDAGDSCWDEVVQVTIGRSGKHEGLEAGIIQSFIVDAERLIGVLNKLMYGQSRIVRLHNHVRYLEQQVQYFMVATLQFHKFYDFSRYF